MEQIHILPQIPSDRKKKIALVLRGHYRSFSNTYQSWKDSLQDCDFTCYFHTWDITEARTRTWYCSERTSRELNPEELELLRSFDPSICIESQTYTKSELEDIYTTAPHKSFVYRFTSLRDTLHRIANEKEKYDMIVVGRYDVLLRNIKWKNVSVKENEITIGGRNSEFFYKNVGASDVLFAFHPSRIDRFDTPPSDYSTRKFRNAEEPFTDFCYKSFVKVHHMWHYDRDFIIAR